MDHEQRLSFAVIFGSFRSRGVEGPELDQHYVSLSYLHEPIGGILPAEYGDEQNGENNATAGDNGEEMEEHGDPEAPKSPQERVSAMADRLGRWIDGQRQAALRSFGADRRGDESTKSAGKAGGGAVESGKGGAIDQDAGAMRDPSEGDADDVDSARRGRPADGPEDAERLVDEERDDQGAGERNSLGEEGMDGDVSRYRQGDDGLDSGDMPAALEPPTTTMPSTEGREDVTREGMLEGGGDAAHGVHGRGLADESTAAELSEAEESDSIAESSVLEQMPIPLPVKQLPLREYHLPKALPPTPLVPPQKHHHLERTHTFHAFPAPDTVTISCRGEAVERVPNLVGDPNFAWEADGVG